MIERLQQSCARRLSVSGIDRLFIVENGPLERLLLDRTLVGQPFRQACLQSSELFLSHLSDELADSFGDIAELSILSKSLCYELPRAFCNVFGENLEVNLIASERKKVIGDEPVIDVMYRRFDSSASSLVIGDTIATGATMCNGLSLYGQEKGLKKVFVLSVAGSLSGAERIQRFCDDKGIQAVFMFGLAAFALGDNGFDLSFLHPKTITSEKYRTRASSQFADRPVSAVGWDFGSQAHSVGKYRNLVWLEAEVWGLHGFPSMAVEKKPADLSILEMEQDAFKEWLDAQRPAEAD